MICNSYKALRGINIWVLYYRKDTTHLLKKSLLYHCNDTYCSIKTNEQDTSGRENQSDPK
jgi:hypothetical protein